MTQNALGDDPWVSEQGGLSPPSARALPPLHVKSIDVVPLDAQLGIFPRKTVPDLLHHVLFGQPVPSAIKVSDAAGDPGVVPPLRTYAILDAAKVTNLAELLEDSGLDYRCLFKGAAYDELKNVAPWIVRLEDGNTFTRNLFTRSAASWHLWDNRPGIYVRSRASLDELWSHFRKFTRVESPSGQWYYLRFWDRSVLNAARRARGDAAFYQKLSKGMTIIWPNPEPDMPNRLSQLMGVAI